MTSVRLFIFGIGFGALLSFTPEVRSTSPRGLEAEDYLTDGGELKQKLVLRDSGGFTGKGTGQKWIIEPSGAWERVAIDKDKRTETTGKLSKKQLADLAKELVRHNLLQLPKECNKLTVADGINVVIEFGEHRCLFHGKNGLPDLPPGDVTSHSGRFAGAARAIQEATRE